MSGTGSSAEASDNNGDNTTVNAVLESDDVINAGNEIMSAVDGENSATQCLPAETVDTRHRTKDSVQSDDSDHSVSDAHDDDAGFDLDSLLPLQEDYQALSLDINDPAPVLWQKNEKTGNNSMLGS